MIDELFNKLVSISSISGNESLFQQLVAQELSQSSSVKFSDILNNYTVQVGSGSKKVLISAHADEVGFIVTYINEDGFIFFQPVGGIEADIAVGQTVKILSLKGEISGIVGRVEIWDTASSSVESSTTPYKDLWIDIGNNKSASQIVSIGDPAIFDTSIKTLQEPYFLARGADDKLGVYSLIQIVKNLAVEPNPNVSLFAVTTTQEEIGSRGAQPAVNRIQPNYSLIIDTIRSTDTPNSNKEEIGLIELGKGPVISRGSNTNPDLFFILTELAKREGIPFQIEAEGGATATDADLIQISGIGTATIIVSIPARYHHFPGEVFSWEDVVNCIKLVSLFIKSLKETI